MNQCPRENSTDVTVLSHHFGLHSFFMYSFQSVSCLQFKHVFSFTANQYKCAVYNLTSIEIGKCLMYCIAHSFQPRCMKWAWINIDLQLGTNTKRISFDIYIVAHFLCESTQTHCGMTNITSQERDKFDSWDRQKWQQYFANCIFSLLTFVNILL